MLPDTAYTRGREGRAQRARRRPGRTTTPRSGWPQPPTALVALTVHGNAFTASPVAPTVRINGWPVPVRYGVNQLPVYAAPVVIGVPLLIVVLLALLA